MKTWKRLMVCALTFGMVFDNTTMISMAAENKNNSMEATEGVVDIDDAVITTTGESFKIQYEPEDAWHGGSGYEDLFLNGTEHYSDRSGQDSYYTMNFVGTGIEIYGSKNVVHSNTNYELFKQGIRDVAKAKYLMEQSAELKSEVNSLVSDMKRLEGIRHNGSAVAANEEQRMLVHAETDRMYEAITELARTVEGQEPVEPPVDSTEPAPWGILAKRVHYL